VEQHARDAHSEGGRPQQHEGRASDIVCRYGGEEFVMAMPNTSMQEVSIRLEQVRKNFQEFRLATFNVGATISIGLAEYPTDSAKLDEILNLADKSMYQAKSAGGNQIISYSKK
jgi:diguanylate cyclase (GGDEF)-like protein